MERPTQYHEVIRPLVETARNIGRFVIDRLWSDVPAQPVIHGGAEFLDSQLYDQDFSYDQLELGE